MTEQTPGPLPVPVPVDGAVGSVGGILAPVLVIEPDRGSWPQPVGVVRALLAPIEQPGSRELLPGGA